MPKLPPISAKPFAPWNASGSSKAARKAAASSCVAALLVVSSPMHREIKVGTLAGVLRQAGVLPDEFIAKV
jgi:hypothetical protein